MARPRGKKTGIYKSQLEARFAADFKLEYEPDSFKYEIPATMHSYTPDWKISETCYIETKGFLGAKDRQKLLYIKEQHPKVIVALVFQKDLKLGERLGTCLSWAKKHGFPAFLETDKSAISLFIKLNK